MYMQVKVAVFIFWGCKVIGMGQIWPVTDLWPWQVTLTFMNGNLHAKYEGSRCHCFVQKFKTKVNFFLK